MGQALRCRLTLSVSIEKVVTEIVAILENKGILPLKIKHFGFKVLTLKDDDASALGDEKIRKQLLFPTLWLKVHLFRSLGIAHSFILGSELSTPLLQQFR